MSRAARARSPRPPFGAPIALQLLALLAGGLIVAQLATIVLVLVLPPQPQQVYRLGEVAAALHGQTVRARDGRPLVLSVRKAAPEPSGDPRRFRRREVRALADLLEVPADRVRLEMRRPPPLAGAVGRLRRQAHVAGPGEPQGPGLEPAPGSFEAFAAGAGRPPPGGLGLGFGGFFAFDEGEAFFDAAEGRRVFESGLPLIGRFTAALRRADGTWAVVEPAAEPFLSDWRRRVLFWFAGCLIVLAPVAYLFARRITAPIRAFARAAERIGRDPMAPLIQLSGPAEIGVAAQAMNDMQVRLKRYVQDRTATIAAVSHDLRTPLARMRFKLEKAPPELRASISRDVDQMEAMVAAVLEFIREGSEPRRRQRLDLLSVVECVVDDAADAGAEVEIVESQPVTVEADGLGLQRMIANLVDNAAKYGKRARVSVRTEGGEGVVEIADEGAGLPEAELEKVFQPFYRVEPSRSRETGGVGLGLAVARSIARAHGGEVTLARAEAGLVARVRLPGAPA